jgi:Family of unknown function (DUF6401)
VFRELSESVRHTAAKAMLADLMTTFGQNGLGAASTCTGLLASVDQHAAAVRDALGDPEDGPNAIGLAGYATGVQDAADDEGWAVSDWSTVDWSTADWLSMRLLGVCALARGRGYA